MSREEFLNKIMKNVVGVLCQNMGWHAVQITSVDILADLMKRYFLQLAKSTHNYAEHYGRTEVNMDDAYLALMDVGVTASDLEEYIQNFDPVLLPYAAKVPDFPLPKESKLNFLRPGSEEVLTRAMHVHEYMPPMIFETPRPPPPPLEEEEEPQKMDISEGEQEEGSGSGSSAAAQNGDVISNETVKVEEKVEESVVMREPSPEKEVVTETEVVAFNGVKMDVDQEDDDSSEDEIEALENGISGSRKFTPFAGLSKTKR
jgi:histone H3/H4